MSHPNGWIYKRFKIEDDLMQTIDNLADTRGEQKADIIAETVEWLVKNRTEGTVSQGIFPALIMPPTRVYG